MHVPNKLFCVEDTGIMRELNPKLKTTQTNFTKIEKCVASRYMGLQPDIACIGSYGSDAICLQ